MFLTLFGGVAGAGAECDFCPRRGGSGQDNKAKGTDYEKVNFCTEVVPEATWLGSEGGDFPLLQREKPFCFRFVFIGKQNIACLFLFMKISDFGGKYGFCYINFR